MNHAAAKNYQTQQIMTASPAKLVAMLFDRAIGSLKEAIDAIGRDDIEARFTANKRATEIVYHLYMTLDLERGGEVAANLKRLYAFALRKLPDVDFRNDAQAAEDIIRLLEPLRRSWHELSQQNPPAAAQGTVAQGTPPRAAAGYAGAAPQPQAAVVGAKQFSFSA